MEPGDLGQLGRMAPYEADLPLLQACLEILAVTAHKARCQPGILAYVCVMQNLTCPYLGTRVELGSARQVELVLVVVCCWTAGCQVKDAQTFQTHQQALRHTHAEAFKFEQ